MNMRIVFMGTPDFAVPSLQGLLEAGFDVAAVYTQPDRPRGRGQKLRFSPVKEAALAAGIAVHQPRTLREEDVAVQLQQLAPDVIVVVAFGQLLPASVLALPRWGCINVHASLLPRHRGAAPIQAALAAGDDVTGVTTMFMDEGLDTGDIILQREVPIEPDDDAGRLHDRLALAGAGLLVETLQRLASGQAPRIPQDDRLATYAPRLTKEAARIDWSNDAAAIAHHVRAFAPRPGAHTIHRGHPVKVLRVHALHEPSPVIGARVGNDEAETADPGTVVRIESEGFVVQAGRGRLLVTRVQPAGRGPMTGRDYSNGFRLAIGERFGAAH